MINDDTLKLENQLCFPMYAVSKEIVRRYKPLLEPLGITYTQYLTLLVLWEHVEISVKKLGEYLYLDSGTLTPLLKRMENQRLLERTRSKKDERIVLVKLTKKGIDLKEKAIHIPNIAVDNLNLSKEQLSVLYNLLYKILDGFSDGNLKNRRKNVNI
ncbi:MarR family winged helix-turn-helix transcriptional regulator [Peptoniphilus stercorisuis]|uniref:DNA-binding MarR family transcriptional regulator n=1 Tax=Peptoniphilus stercorisuis TaxID=1436965 RepID=A0ABS4KAB2_9FIRM|nr:MarR family transcriptional regulator [Peptoniphilus stercorisuis]MBP2024714.1 DNA-binding MarR family transcriptional regulator [Peptoniphilus stercorisuis]